MLSRLIQRKFGQQPEQVQNKLANANLATLEIWTDRILDAQTLDGVFGAKEHVITH